MIARKKWRRAALAALATAALAGSAAAQDILPDLSPRRPADQGVDLQSLPDAEDQAVPEPYPDDQPVEPEQTEALPASPDASGSDELIEPQTGALPEPEVIEPPIAPEIASPAPVEPEVIEPPAPEIAAPPTPAVPKADTASAPAVPDADPAMLPDGDTAAEKPARADVDPLRLGVVPSGNAAKTIAALEPLRTRLAEKLARPVEILPMASYRALIDAQTLQRIDGGLFSASAYAAAEAMCDCLEPLAAPAAEDGSTAYQAVIVVRPESGITAAAGLQGKVIATAPAGSVGGRRMQLAGLMAEGLEIKTLFGRVRTMPSAADAVRLVLAGDADAAFAWGPLAEGGADAGGTLSWLTATGELAAGGLTVIWRSPPIEHGPFAVAKTLPDDAKMTIRDALVGLATVEPAAYDALSPIYGGGFVAVEPSAYKGVALLAEQNVDAALPAGTIEPAAPRVQRQTAETQPQ